MSRHRRENICAETFLPNYLHESDGLCAGVGVYPSRQTFSIHSWYQLALLLMIHESFYLNRLLINAKRLIKRTQSPSAGLACLSWDHGIFHKREQFLGFRTHTGEVFEGRVRINFHSIALIRPEVPFVAKQNHGTSLPHECATSKLTKKFAIREIRVNLPFSSFRHQFPCIPSKFGDCSKHERRSRL